MTWPPTTPKSTPFTPFGADSKSSTAQFVHNEWIESYDPTIEDSYRTQQSVDVGQVLPPVNLSPSNEDAVCVGPSSRPGDVSSLTLLNLTCQINMNP